MKPQKSPQDTPSTFQLFQTQLENLINSNHPLVHLAHLIHWNRFDEELVKRWLENPYWQYFCGETLFQTDFPCDDTSLGIWRKRIGEDKLKLVLEETIRIAKEKKFVTEKELSEVVVDTTVQEKNITFPTNAKLLSRAIMKLAKLCLSHKIKLRQSYARKAKRWVRKASGYGAARQFNRLACCNQDLKNWLGRVLRDIENKRENKALSLRFLQLIEIANKLLVQEKKTPKEIYSLHEPVVCCIGKGNIFPCAVGLGQFLSFLGIMDEVMGRYDSPKTLARTNGGKLKNVKKRLFRRRLSPLILESAQSLCNGSAENSVKLGIYTISV
jgi:IS5 family transposase